MISISAFEFFILGCQWIVVISALLIIAGLAWTIVLTLLDI